MNKKLTLNIDENIIKFAHDYSKKTNQSISAIVEKYFANLKSTSSTKDISKTTHDLYGILSDKPLPDKKI
jgi:hypothetical protein